MLSSLAKQLVSQILFYCLFVEISIPSGLSWECGKSQILFYFIPTLVTKSAPSLILVHLFVGMAFPKGQ
jgi:hypothetical protein